MATTLHLRAGQVLLASALAVSASAQAQHKLFVTDLGRATTGHALDNAGQVTGYARFGRVKTTAFIE